MNTRYHSILTNKTIKYLYEHMPPEDQLYESYKEFVKAPTDEKFMKQYIILQERLKCAENILTKCMENIYD